MRPSEQVPPTSAYEEVEFSAGTENIGGSGLILPEACKRA